MSQCHAHFHGRAASLSSPCTTPCEKKCCQPRSSTTPCGTRRQICDSSVSCLDWISRIFPVGGRQRQEHRASGQRGKPARSHGWTGAAPPRAKSGGRPREPAGAQPRVGGRGRRPLPPRRAPPMKVMRGRQTGHPWPVVAGDRRRLLAATFALPWSGQPREPGGAGAPGQPAVHAAAFAPLPSAPPPAS